MSAHHRYRHRLSSNPDHSYSLRFDHGSQSNVNYYRFCTNQKIIPMLVTVTTKLPLIQRQKHVLSLYAKVGQYSVLIWAKK